MNLLSTLLAQTIENPSLGNLGGKFKPEESGAYFSSLLSVLVTIILIAGGVIFMFMFLFGGVRWITSGGDKASTEAARGTLTNALIGLLIMFATWAIITLIENIFGIKLLELNIPSLV